MFPSTFKTVRFSVVFSFIGLFSAMYGVCFPLILGLLASDSLASGESERIETIRRVKPSVVAVFGSNAAGGGSGVLISPDGFAVTNFHVVSGIGTALRCGLDNGELYDAVLVGVDPVGDVAMIQLLGREDFPFSPLGDSDRLEVGQAVLAMGNPFLLATDFQPSVSLGIVSGLHRYQHPAQSAKGSLLEYTDCIQTDASINPGNSGGPLFDLAGNVIGINGRISLDKRGRVNVGVGYAISINQIKNFRDHLAGGLIVDHANLGATVVSTADGRTVVNDVLNSSDAFHQGLRAGDEVVSFGGRPVGSPNEFLNVLGTFPKNWRVPLVYRRAQQQHEIRPRLMGKHRDLQLQNILVPDGPPMPGAQKKPPLPASVAAVHEEKAGFANYHFNRRRRDELLQSIGKLNAAKFPGKWTATLKDRDETDILLTLEDAAAHWKSATSEVSYPDVAGDVDSRVVALLQGMESWRRLMFDQEKWFSECHFAGGFDEGGELLSPGLETERAGVRMLWLFERDSKSLRSVTFAGDETRGWSRIVFSDERPTETGLTLPHSIRSELSGSEVLELQVTKWEVSP